VDKARYALKGLALVKARERYEKIEERAGSRQSGTEPMEYREFQYE
jgi:hypothetical protein